MGKTVQINKDFNAVSLPPDGRFYNGGQTTTLTDAEYASLPAATVRAITVTGTVPDPTRPDSPSTGQNTVSISGPVEISNDLGKAIPITNDQSAPTSKLRVGSSRSMFRDNFATPGTQPDPTVWTMSNPDGHIVTRGGNAAGASYLRVSLDPFTEGSEVLLVSKQLFQFPFRLGFGVSMSQRVSGQEVFYGFAADDGNGGVDTSLTTNEPDLAMPATVSITTNVATIVINNHGIQGGDRLNIFGCPDSRLNVGPVVATVVDINTITVPLTLANGTYTSTGGTLRYVDPMRYASNAAGYLWGDNNTVTNVSTVMRRNGQKFRSFNTAAVTSVATQTNTSPYTDALNSTAQNEIDASLEELRFRAYSADNPGTLTAVTKFTQGIPDENPSYHVVLRARNLSGITKPIARITAISKSGTTTATVTTDVPHGLTTADWIQIYGVLDRTNFTELTAQTQVASVIDATHFTVVMGAAVTASSSGGTVVRVQGGSLFTTQALANSIASIACTTNGVLTVTTAATMATLPLPGEYWQLWGMQGGAATYDGGYKVLRATGTTLELEALNATTFGSITTGGALFRRTDVRFHFARVMDFTRLIAEIAGGRGNTLDINNSVPVSIAGSAVISVAQTSGTNTTTWQVGQASGYGIVDLASAALTATTTTSPTTLGQLDLVGHGAYVIQVAVTAVSGTNPTLDVVVQESVDAGTNWNDIYHFERITAAGSYTTPQLRLQRGSRVRFVQTVGGTTPSFTRSIRRNVFNLTAPVFYRFFDRTVVPNTLNSTTPTWDVKGAETLQLIVVLGAGGTAWPTFQLEGSEDGTNWYPLGGTLATTAASATYKLTVASEMATYVRARVTAAGTASVLTYACVKAIGR